SGGRYISASVAEKLAEALGTPSDQTPASILSDREFEVFRLLAAGKTVGEISRMLKRSVKTISTHRTHILQKMNLENNAGIMQYAVQHKLLE
ncbi:MAG: response regulator transcription factor, partial [bacterium]